MRGSVAASGAARRVAGMPSFDRFLPCRIASSRSSSSEVVAFDLSIPRRCSAGNRRLYEWAVCGPAPGPVPTETGFDVLVPHGLDALDARGHGRRARDRRPRVAAAAEPLAALRGVAGAARGSRRSARARSCSPPPGCSTAAARRRTGATRAGSRGSSPPSPSIPTSSTSTTATCSPRPASPPASTSACTWSAPTTAPRRRTRSRARWSSPRTATAARRSSSSGRCRRTRATASRRRARGCRSGWRSRSTVERMARHAGYSPRSFARRFRAETGTTPLQWLIALRVAEARRLLEATELPIEAVAGRAGSARRWRCGSTSRGGSHSPSAIDGLPGGSGACERRHRGTARPVENVARGMIRRVCDVYRPYRGNVARPLEPAFDATFPPNPLLLPAVGPAEPACGVP